MSLLTAREKLENFLLHCDGQSLQQEMNSPWLNEIMPGLDLLSGCDQGTKKHFEGDVAVHTALVFDHILLAAENRLGRSADFIERLSVLLHDLRKPQTRLAKEDGSVSFLDHEARAADEIPEIAAKLGLSQSEERRLHFLVARHGETHGWSKLTEEQKQDLRSSPWIESLALLHEADAKSCILVDGSHHPVYWEELTDR